MMRMVFWAGLFGLVFVYLFVSAPAPLPDNRPDANAVDATVPIATLFDIVNLVNSGARQLYTERIVSAGAAAGLKFDERWLDEGVEAGPLPALFLRLTASKLEAMRSPLSLFLGSDNSINSSNQFQGEQVAAFKRMRVALAPQYFDMPTLNTTVGMYPDLASAPGCVRCHNEHERTPKKDWKLNDLMGATTWTYPRATVTAQEARSRVAELYRSINEAYATYLGRVTAFGQPIEIGKNWPADGRRALPDAQTFMQAVYAATGPEVARLAVADLEPTRQ
jgi:adenylate cyclase